MLVAEKEFILNISLKSKILISEIITNIGFEGSQLFLGNQKIQFHLSNLQSIKKSVSVTKLVKMLLEDNLFRKYEKGLPVLEFILNEELVYFYFHVVDIKNNIKYYYSKSSILYKDGKINNGLMNVISGINIGRITWDSYKTE